MPRKCDSFFAKQEARGDAVVYSEVRLKTGHSEVMPADVSLATMFSRHVALKIPIVSAAMDTVTESRMAIAMAKLGGLGVIHRNLSPEEQKNEVRRVKFHLSGLIASPITVFPDMTLEAINSMREEHKFTFHSFPVVERESGRLVGLITHNDFKLCDSLEQKASEVMTRDLVTSGPDTKYDEALRKMKAAKKMVLPLVDDDRRLAGMYLFSDVIRNTSESTGFNLDEQGRLRVSAAIGTGDDALRRVELLQKFLRVVVIDTAHGDSRPVFDTLREIKRVYGDDLDVVVGNISEGDSAKRLLDAGADGIKVGQGPGSICTTRVVAGVGCPQVTAVYNAAKATEGSGVPIGADGGIEQTGDIPIALGAGGHYVMLGRMLAGTKEAPGDVDMQHGYPVKSYRGMGSLSALQSSESSRNRYRQDNGVPVPEGVEATVPYVGELETVMKQYLGGLRKGMGYAGAASVEKLRQEADFYRISTAGQAESHPHGVNIIKDAPNYRRNEP